MKTSIASAVSLVLLSSLVTAHAQTGTQGTETKPTEATGTPKTEKADSKKTEVIAVTGTRIKRVDMNVAAPLTILGREEIQASGKQTVTDIVKALPAAIGNSVTTTTTNGGGNGSGNIALRGLDSSSTLVLLNGRRLPLDAFGSSPDLNSIPVAAIDRIEILQDGASAIYGSDAIAGVINIITRKNWDGLDFSLYLGQSSRGDLETSSLDITYGATNDRGGMLLGANVYKQGKVASRDRDVSKQTLGPSSATPNSHVVLDEDTEVISNDTWANPDAPTGDDFRPYTSDDSYNFSSVTDAIMAQTRRSIFLSGDYELTKNLKGFIETHFTNTHSDYNSAPTPIFLSQETGDLSIPAESPYNPFDVELTDVRKRLLQLGPRVSDADSDTFRNVIGVQGEITDKWNWDLAYNHGESKTRDSTKNIVNKTNLQLGIGDATHCESLANLGCVPVNILGPDGSLTPEMMNWLRISATNYTTTELDSVTVNFAGELAQTGLGTIGLAFGVEGRTEDYKSRSDPNAEQYNTIGSTNSKSTQGDRDIKEAYVEVIVPLTKVAEINLAARHSDYSDFGTTTNPKVGVKIRPIEGLNIRGSYSTGFRAPSLVELFQGQQENFATLNDPCQAENNDCGFQSDPNIEQFLALQGGNPELEPEKSKSYTYGVTYSYQNFNAKADYFNIETKNAIDTNPQFIVDQFRNNGLFGDKIQLDENQNITSIEAIALNLASRKVEGVDIGVDYALRGTPAGAFTFSLLGSHYIKYMNQADKSAEFENVVGRYVDSSSGGRGSIPKWKGLLDVAWSNFGFDAGATANHVTELDATAPDIVLTKLAAWTTFDVRAGYDFLNFGTLTVGINNVTDKEPPVTDAAFNDNIDARTHNLIGRFYYARWGVQL